MRDRVVRGVGRMRGKGDDQDSLPERPPDPLATPPLPHCDAHPPLHAQQPRRPVQHARCSHAAEYSRTNFESKTTGPCADGVI